MKTFMITVVFILVAGTALAGYEHHRVSPDMNKQHSAMLATDKEWELCKKSLATGDLAAAGAALERMKTVLIDLEKFRPHRRQERYMEFQEEARNFKIKLTKLMEAVKEKKNGETQGLLDKIDGGCMMCHEKFR